MYEICYQLFMYILTKQTYFNPMYFYWESFYSVTNFWCILIIEKHE